MWLQSLRNQLVRDLKASWQKTALLGTLLLVGLWFWIPPLVRAVSRTSSQITASRDVRPSTASTSDADATPSAGPAENATVVYAWENAEELLERDPLVQSAEVAARHSDPFGIDADQFPPPLLFAPEPAQAEWSDPEGHSLATTATTSNKLRLRSTIVGEHRRAALINRKLYLEGSAIEVSGKTYLLAAVFPRKVVLRSGDEMLELEMATPFLRGNPDPATLQREPIPD